MTTLSLVVHSANSGVMHRFATILHRAFHVVIVTLIVSGCVSVPETRDPPDWSGVGNIEKKPAADAKDLPELCEVEVAETELGRRATWSQPCWNILEAFEVIAIGNTKIARANTSALRSTEAANDTFIEAGKLQQQLSNFYLDLLKDERQGRQLDVLTYRVLIAVVALGALL